MTIHISQTIWDGKYRLKNLDGTPIDLTEQDTRRRVAKALAVPEQEPHVWEERFFNVMENGYFIPAGRIIAGAGSDRNVTLSNCYTMGTIPDSMSGIFEALKEAALTMQAGGGIGYDFSTLRPKGAPVKGVVADASGPLSFMDVWDAMCRTIMSAGSRRGAMMATLRCDHPDIEAFVTAKHDATRLRMFNLSVLVTDDFMAAVKNDLPWRLHFENRHGETISEKTIQARDLWNLIMDSTYNYAEPGVIFIDRVNRDHNLSYLPNKTIATTNPCGEQPMPPYSSCLLGSINLAKLVRNSFTADAYVDWEELILAVNIAIRMMDNVIDVNRFPISQQEVVAKEERRLGLGITGLADALIMLGVKYGSEEAVFWTENFMQMITLTAYEQSIDLAEEKGCFPLYSHDYMKGNTFVNRMLNPGLKKRIKKTGLRNSLLISIAPTGTISLYAGNISSGIEPVFALGYTRKVLQPDGSKVEKTVEDWAVSEYHRLFPGQELPDTFVTAQDLTPEDHLVMQGAAQKWVDSSISKTINLPEDIAFEDFQAVYLRAYELGCKGCTTYRPNAVTGSVLSVEPKKEEKIETPVVSTEMTLTKRPRDLPGATYKIKLGAENAVYLTVTDIEENGIRRPFEVFINTKNPEHYAWTTALTRMISAIFRRPHDSSFVAEELKQVFDPKGGGFSNGRYVPSIVAAIGIELERHMQAIGYIQSPEKLIQFEPEVPTITTMVAPLLCKSCGSDNVTLSGGCPVCGDCGYSKCG